MNPHVPFARAGAGRRLLVASLSAVLAGAVLVGCTKSPSSTQSPTPPTTPSTTPPTTTPPGGKAKVVNDVVALDPHFSRSFTINQPGGAAGNLLVAYVVAVGSHPDKQSVPPAGWHAVIYNLHAGIWYRKASSSDPPSWTWHSGHARGYRWFGEILVVSGATSIQAASGQPLCTRPGDFVCDKYAGDVRSTCLTSGCGTQLPAPSVSLQRSGLVIGFWVAHRPAAPIQVPSGFEKIQSVDVFLAEASGSADFSKGPTGVQSATGSRLYVHGIAQLVTFT